MSFSHSFWKLNGVVSTLPQAVVMSDSAKRKTILPSLTGSKYYRQNDHLRIQRAYTDSVNGIRRAVYPFGLIYTTKCKWCDKCETPQWFFI